MSKKNQYKKTLDNIELKFDEMLLHFREADENGKLNQKLRIQLESLKQLVMRTASEVLKEDSGPLRW